MITNVKDTTVTVKVADNVKIEMDKSAVTNVVSPTDKISRLFFEITE